MLVFTFFIGTAPKVDANLFDVECCDGDTIDITGNIVDATFSGLFSEAARIPNATVYPAGQPWRAVPAYRWYGQLIARHDYMACRIEGRYARIAKCVPHVE